MRRFTPAQRSTIVGSLFIPAALCLSLEATASTSRADRGSADRKVDFLRDVRPILAQHCFQCHGPDDNARKAKLRLDQKEAAFAERKGKFVVAPNAPESSLLFERITSDNEKRRMPPDGKAEALTEKKIETLRLWIEQGAAWPEHWAFVAPKRPALPEVRKSEWVRDPIDRFVLTKLETENLNPNPEATREAWLRRASFDLTGLPPTPQELDEFLKDTSPNAYANQADRLLASTRYGERQTQEWLDLARYADTGGYQNDSPRQMWKWREWVINAYNANMPFDQFTIEQLAGDLLPNATLSQKVATGFNRNHPTNSEAGEEEDEYRSAYVIDRVNTTATTFMGLTLACTQCHDHKYDPLSQRDYYSFYSFFNSVKERDSDGFFKNPRPSIPVPNPDQEPRLKDIQARKKTLEKRLEAADPLADADQKEWETKILGILGEPTVWTTMEPVGLLSRNGSLLKRMEDGSILSTGPTPVKDTYDVVVQPGKRKITALRLEVLPDDSQPNKASGRATDGRFILSGLEVRNSTLSESQDPPLVVFTKGEADLKQEIDPEDMSIMDEFPGTIDPALEIKDPPPGGGMGMGMGMDFGRGGGWCIVGDEKKAPHEVLLLPRDPLELNDASVLRISLDHTSQQKYKSLIGRFRLSFTEDEGIRKLMLPVLGKAWSSLGPFPAEDVEKAYETVFEPEKDITKDTTKGIDLRKTYAKVVLPPGADGKTPGGPGAAGAGAGAAAGAAAGKDGAKPEGADGAPKKPGEGDKKVAEGADKNANEKNPNKPDAAGAKGEIAKNDGAKPDGSKGDSSKADGAKVDEPPMKPGELKIPKAPAAEDGKLADANKTDGAESKPGDGKSADGKGADGKTPGGKSFGKKPGGFGKNDTNAKDPKVADADKKDADKKDDKKDGDKPGDDKNPRGPKKDDKLAWTEQPRWRDGQSARLADTKNSAYYLTRKVVCEGPRTALLQIDGPEGVRVWLNGEPVHSQVPNPPKEPKKKEGDEEPDQFAILEAMFGGGQKEDKRFRLGLRAGENDLTVKVVYGAGGGGGGRGMGGGGMGFGGMGGGGGGGSFLFAITPEGDDVVSYEVVAALRKEAIERAKANDPAAAVNPTDSRPAPAAQEVAPGIAPGAGAALPSGGEPKDSSTKDSNTKSTNPKDTDPKDTETNEAAAKDPKKVSNASGRTPANLHVGAAGPLAVATSAPGDSAKGSAVDESAGDDKVGDPKNVDPKNDDAKKDDDKKEPAKTIDAFPQGGKVGEIAIEKIKELENDQTPKDAKPKLTPEQARQKVIRLYFRSRLNTVGKAIYDELQRLKAEEAKLKREIPESMVMEELEKPRQAYIFRRGLYKNKGDKVSSNVPAVLPPMANDLPKNRLGLAKWLVSKDHPLTARVTVNRIWKQYFGSGLVKTAEDFGIRGELPTHPELLDYLALEFIESGWDMKALHKRIVLSATYRQSSAMDPDKLEKDPENRWLSRGPRLRLSAEMIRDNALSLSGLLVEKIGGESVRPFQPAGISKVVTGGQDYKKEKGEGQYRRGLYVFWKRGAPYASMLTFDAPKRDTCIVTRPYTTTPLQALTLLNDPVYVECAKMFGQRLLKHTAKDDAARLQWGFRLCTSRAPSDAELEVLKKLLADEREAYKSDAEGTKKLLASGDSKIDEKLDAAEVAAWAAVCNALLNLDATIHRG